MSDPENRDDVLAARMSAAVREMVLPHADPYAARYQREALAERRRWSFPARSLALLAAAVIMALVLITGGGRLIWQTTNIAGSRQCATATPPAVTGCATGQPTGTGVTPGP